MRTARTAAAITITLFLSALLPPLSASADCATAPPSATGNSSGYLLSAGATWLINGSCVMNSGTNSYFVPAKTTTELNDFTAAIPHLAGLSSPPTASITANSSTDITVNVGDYVSYSVSNGNCATVDSSVYQDGALLFHPWMVGAQCNSQPGGGYIPASYAGHTYTLYYTVYNATNQSKTASATVRVAELFQAHDTTSGAWANSSTAYSMKVCASDYIDYYFAPSANCSSTFGSFTTSDNSFSSSNWAQTVARYCSSTVYTDGQEPSGSRTWYLIYGFNNAAGPFSQQIDLNVNC